MDLKALIFIYHVPTAIEDGDEELSTRSQTKVEVYISLYYDTRIKPYICHRALQSRQSLVCAYWDYPRDRFASEEQEILDEVDKEITARLEAATRALEAVEGSQITPEQYQQ